MLLAVYGQRVELLGSRLGVDPQYCAVFAEGRIRSNLIFQLAKVSHVLTRSFRQHLHQEPYDVLVPGQFVGKVAVAEKLDEALLPLLKTEKKKLKAKEEAYEPLLVCSRIASGDEEIAGIDDGGKCAAGLVVGHDIPILSHLGQAQRQTAEYFK